MRDAVRSAEPFVSVGARRESGWVVELDPYGAARLLKELSDDLAADPTNDRGRKASLIPRIKNDLAFNGRLASS